VPIAALTGRDRKLTRLEDAVGFLATDADFVDMAMELAYGAAYLGGHPRSPKPVANCAIGIAGDGVTVQRLFTTLIHEPWVNVSALTAEGPAEVQTRFTATRLAVLGPLALAFKKEKNSACFIAVEGRFGQFVVEVKKKSVYQLRAELAPWQGLVGLPGPGYLKCQACGNFIPPRSGRCSRCGLRVGETPAAEAATGIADQLAQLAELHGAGALTDEEFVVAKQALLSPSIKP
jgi:hypothetical protein